MATKSARRQRRGFTLIEVLLVLVILATLAGFAAVNIGPMRLKANINSAKAQIGQLKAPLEAYSLDIGGYPASLDALRVSDGNQAWAGPYLSSDLPADPWGRPYNYAAPGRHNPDSYDVWSTGPDGVDGSEDDIGNWQ